MVRPLVAILLLVLSAQSTEADGIMLVQAGAFWMGRDDGPREPARAPTTCTTCSAI